MSWTCPGHYKVHVHGRDSPGRPVHGHCPVPLPALPAVRKICEHISALMTCHMVWRIYTHQIKSGYF